MNTQDINGWTPMITAIINRNKKIEEVINILMKLGGDQFLQSNDGKNAFHWAARIGTTSALKAIIESSTNEQVEKLLNCETNDEHKIKPIHIAARYDQAQAFSYLFNLEKHNRESCSHSESQIIDNEESKFVKF